MPRQVTEIQVFVASPGDMVEAKETVKLVCDEINQDFQDMYRVRFLKKDWETSIVSEFSPRVQDMVFARIGDYDVFIGVLGNRFGTPTGVINPDTGREYQSGTEEEFYQAYNRWKKGKAVRMNFYFKAPDVVTTAQEVEHLQKVLEFKERLRSELRQVPLEFADYREFERRVRRFLHKVAQDFNKPKEPSEVVRPEEWGKEVKRIVYPDVEYYLPRRVVPAKQRKPTYRALFIDDLAKDLVDIIEQHNRVVVLGDAGSGKTTELRRIAAECSRQGSRFYPFLFLLSRFTNQPVSEMLDGRWRNVPMDQLLVLLDGLDEVPPGDQNHAVRHIELFAEQRPAAHIVVSSRTNFYHLETEQTPGSLAGFRSYALLDLDKGEVKKYVETRL
jgi:hypothetical protein